MSLQIFLNDRLVPQEQAMVSVFDHGLLYGDGVFEGIRVYNKRVFLLTEHVERLYESALAIRLVIPMWRKQSQPMGLSMGMCGW
jgi:branched-chain amino acid aminotransferase